jgi:hypothetical protein
MRTRIAVLCVLLLAPAAAQAYCIHNQLSDRQVQVWQPQLKDSLRENRELNVTIAPGKSHCCRNLDCNPGGRSESVTTLHLKILGDPEYLCGTAERSSEIKVTGDGTVRVQNNPRYPKSHVRYITRIRSGQKDLTGPSGLSCLAPPAPPKDAAKEAPKDAPAKDKK